MPMRTATTVTFFYALGYPIGNLAVHALSPMAVLAFRFGLAGLFLGTWAALARVRFPTGRKLLHVAFAGLLMQAVQFCALYIAIQHGAPAVLCAVVIAMNPVATALLAAVFLRDRLTPRRVLALVLGVAAVLAACATRLMASGGIDPRSDCCWWHCSAWPPAGLSAEVLPDVDFRASTSVQNAVAFIPALALALTTPVEVHDVTKAVLAVAGVVLLNAMLGVSLYVRAINLHGASAVAMLFCVIPAVAGVLSWFMLGERVNLGIAAGLVLGAVACWLNASGARGLGEKRQDDPADDGRGQHRIDTVHDPAVAG